MRKLVATFGIGAAFTLYSFSVCAGDTPPQVQGVVRIGEREAKPKSSSTIRLTTYNIENLFDDHDDPSLVGKEDDWYDQDKGLRAKPESQQEAVSQAIRAIDSDIIAVEEIESLEALVEFREKHLKGLGYDYVQSIDVGADRGMQTGVLSRFPITEARVWPNLDLGGVHPDKYGDKENFLAGQPMVFRRSPLFVKIAVPAGARGNKDPYVLDLFVVHHKSGQYSGYWRDAESRALIGLLNDLLDRDPQANVAILGDFNAQPDEPSVTAYEQAGLTHADTTTSSDPAHLTHSSGRAIDFILVNNNLKAEIVAGSAFAFGTPVLPEDADWRTTPQPVGFGSDHMPVSVDITPVNK